MNPMTVLLWLICVFLTIAFFGFAGLVIYMIKERKKAIKEFYTHREAMNLNFKASQRNINSNSEIEL
ncbi:MAG: hypothetical protein GAK29_02166 [Acinetobacter bereziniae]|uniref:Uncharacterized protein n=1 Tax=Acinetobacter bereziniae TaxID=106648 RepID=A0A833PFE5_ACIBZ|nr:MAG: hypothetical protein GAK29_02166 [Acinetobacter bereziniae]